jgi:F420-0:gamma-glutamyl ligase
VVVVTSKIVSLCENRVVPLADTSKKQLVEQEASQYLASELSQYGHLFTITNDTLIPSAGIDESNGDSHYVLWPKDPQASANAIRAHLASKHQLDNIGVIITDSTSQPLRRGISGIVLAHSGFLALKDYRGQPDLFGRPLGVSVANVASGLAAAAVLAMGEGAEQTPLALAARKPLVLES